MQGPKLFISYCWSSPEHEDWVLRLGTELRENGVDAILDKWDLKEGHDANAFMERMVSDADIKKVIIVIDEQYSDKANARRGGVGTETQIISAEIYESVDQNKFVAVVAKRDDKGEANLPIYYKSRIYIDLSSNELYGKNFEQLLRWIYDKPLYIKPDVGARPAFLEEKSLISIGTSAVSRRYLDAVKNSRPFADGALVDYLDQFSKGISKFRLPASKGDVNFDDNVIESIELFLPARNELIEVLSTVAQYSSSPSTAPALHRFFESLIPYLNYEPTSGAYHKWDLDNLKFIIQECFVLAISIFVKHERYDLAGHLMLSGYYMEKDENYGRSKICSFGVFRSHLESLSYRSSKLKLNRLSLHADLLKERCSDSGIPFNQLMQADFLLYIGEAIQAIRDGRSQEWWPETLVFKTFHGGTFEVFSRSESTSYFSKLGTILGVSKKSDLDPLLEAITQKSIYVPKWHFERISPLELLNYDKLCTRP